MKMEDFKRGRKVEDTWFPDWGVGRVIKRTYNRLFLNMPNCPEADEDGVVVYDGPHARAFLKLVDRR